MRHCNIQLKRKVQKQRGFYLTSIRYNKLEGFHTLLPITCKKTRFQHAIKHLVQPNERCEATPNMLRTCTTIWDSTPRMIFFVSSHVYGTCLFAYLHYFFTLPSLYVSFYVVSCKETRHIFHSHERTQNKSKYSINLSKSSMK